MYSHTGTIHAIPSPPDTYQFPQHILNSQIHPPNSQQSFQYNNEVFKFPHNQQMNFESFQSIMNGRNVNQGYPIPSVSSAVNLYPPLTTGGQCVVSSGISQSSSNKSMASTINTSSTATVSTNIQVSSTDPKGEIMIENPVLAFIRSQMLRLTQADVLSSVSVNFSLEELKTARETLFRKTGTKIYKYSGPNDPATQAEKSSHCCAGIISKLQDLQKKGISVNCLCSAKDLFRISTILCKSSVNMVASSNKVDKDTIDEHARRIGLIESDIRYLKSLPHNVNPAAVPAPRYIPADNRLDFLKALGKPTALSSPSKRRKTTPRPSSPLVRGNSGGATSPAVPSSPAWQTVKARKRNKPELDHIPKARPPRESSNSLQVFLFRYHEEETPSSVLKYFQEIGVSSAFHARYCCHEDSRSKNFVLRFRNKEDFPKIIKGLPEHTGCRWYTPDPPTIDEGRPQGYFNFAGRIKGPDIESILGDDSVMDTSSMDLSASQHNDPSTATTTHIVNSSQTAITSVTSSQQGPVSSSTLQTSNSVHPSSSAVDPGPGVTMNDPVPISEAGKTILNGISVLKSPQMNKSAAVTMSNPVPSSSPLTASGNNLPSLNSVLDSPHLQTDKVSYQKFVHDSDVDNK